MCCVSVSERGIEAGFQTGGGDTFSPPPPPKIIVFTINRFSCTSSKQHFSNQFILKHRSCNICIVTERLHIA